MIIKGTKEESKLIRWVQKGAATDKARPVLTGINVADGAMVATDGYRLHAAKAPDCLSEGLHKGKVPSGDFVAELEPIEGSCVSTARTAPLRFAALTGGTR